MAVPIVIGAVAAATAAYGAIKGTKGAVDHKDAKNINSSVARVVSVNVSDTDRYREKTNATLEQYGLNKLGVFESTIPDFLETFGRLRNVELLATPELDKLNLEDFSTVSLTGLKNDYALLQSSGLGLGTGLAGGAALAFGAYSGTMMLATASTGTAISTLSGAAATNATLAWLGGGSLAAGGGGVALGAVVLGGIVAGPALAIFGHIVGNKGEEALNKAKSDMEQTKTFAAEMKLIRDKLAAIQNVAALANTVFSKISQHLDVAIRDLKQTIDEHGLDYQKFPDSAREKVFRLVKSAQLVKAMLDTPILDEDGNLVLATKKRVQDIRSLA
jgi:hypothetical protein